MQLGINIIVSVSNAALFAIVDCALKTHNTSFAFLDKQRLLRIPGTNSYKKCEPYKSTYTRREFITQKLDRS